jgi:hypothetical protein
MFRYGPDRRDHGDRAHTEVHMVATRATRTIADEALSSPQALLAALNASAGRRLPLSVGGVANDDDHADDADDDHDRDAGLRRHWLLDGGLVEMCALPGAGALTAALRLALQARARAQARGTPRHLAVVDASASLCAAALAHVLHADARADNADDGDTVDDDDDDALPETLVVRPGPGLGAVLGCTQRIVESGAVAAVVVDMSHVRDLSAAVVACRRLMVAAEATGVVVVLVTSPLAHRALPVPSAARADVEVDRVSRHPRLRARRHRFGLPPPLVVERPPSVSEAIAHQLRTRATTTTTATTMTITTEQARWP